MSGWFNGQQKRQQVHSWLYFCWAQTSFEMEDYCSWCAGYCNSQCFGFILCNFSLVVIFPVSVSHLCSWSIAKFSSDKALQAFSSHSSQVVGRSTWYIKVVHLWSWKRSVSLWVYSCSMRFHWTGSSRLIIGSYLYTHHLAAVFGCQHLAAQLSDFESPILSWVMALK